MISLVYVYLTWTLCTLTTDSCPYANFAVTCGTGGYRYDAAELFKQMMSESQRSTILVSSYCSPWYHKKPLVLSKAGADQGQVPASHQETIHHRVIS